VTTASPTSGDVEAFLAADGWRQISPGERGGRRQRHTFFEKRPPDGRILQTHISHDRSATISAGRFAGILRHQLEVSRAQFWDAIATGQPVDRPVELDEGAPVEHDAWVVSVLVGELHMSAEEIEKLSREEAIELVHQHWSRPPS
jgi:hypothetical protein